jgi:hypothetical protein
VGSARDRRGPSFGWRHPVRTAENLRVTPRIVRLALLVFIGGLVVPLQAQFAETPITVEPGRFLAEIDGIRFAVDQPAGGGPKVTALAVASTLLTAGLTPRVDIQIGADFYVRRTIELKGFSDSRSGVGDVYFRTKWNFWRDASTGGAAAIIPYVIVPTANSLVGSKAMRGGVIVPWEIKPSEGFTAGANFAWDLVRNDADNGYDSQFALNAIARQDITKSLALYAESALTATSAGMSLWEGRAGAGVLLEVTRNIQLDYEIVRGLNRRATDWEHVLRVNWGW